jgi:hypothetical protein
VFSFCAWQAALHKGMEGYVEIALEILRCRPFGLTRKVVELFFDRVSCARLVDHELTTQ